MEPTSSISTSSSLIRQVQVGEPLAWVRLSQLYAPLVFAWCRRAGLQNADIADVVQNVFAAVHKGIPTFRRAAASDTFCGWLWTITRNEIRAHFRRRAGQPQAVGGTDAQQRIEQVPEILQAETAPLDSAAEQHLVHRALRILEPEFEPTTWRAFRRTTIDGQPAPEVAVELGMSAGAVRQAKHRVLVRLREFLADG